MAINKKLALDTFKKDYKNSEDYHDVWQDKRTDWVREENGEAYGNEEKGKSTLVSRDIKKVNASQHASIIAPFVSAQNMVDISPITAEDKQTSDQTELLLNYQFCRDFPRYNFISESFKIQQREGTVVVKVAWEFEEEEMEVEEPIMEQRLVPTQQGMVPQMVQTGVEMVTRMVTTVNKPTSEVCDNTMIYIDPTCIGDIANAQFVIHKYMSNMSKLRSAGLYENLEKIMGDSQTPYTGEDDDYIKRDDNGFQFSDKPRQELEVFEYWGNFDINEDGIAEAVVCVWVNDVIIRFEENPYPDKMHPFVSCAYDNEPFNINGKATADTIGVDQRIKTSIKRAMNNTLDSGTQGQKGYPKGMLDPINQKRFREGKDFQFNMGEASNIWVGQFADIPNNTMNYLDSVSQEIEALSGVITLGSSHGASSLGSSATAASGLLSSSERREVDISRNLKENLIVPMLRKWHSMNVEFLEDEQIIRVTNDEFVAIRRDDLYGRVDIDISVATPATDLAKANDISFMLQTMSQSLPFDLTKMLLSEYAKLKQMPELAAGIENYQPQPDPFEEQMKQLELQKMQSEINERNSRAVENESDIALKDAKTNTEIAKTRKTHADADSVDLDFLDKQSGNDIRKQNAVQDNKDLNQGILNKQKTNS